MIELVRKHKKLTVIGFVILVLFCRNILIHTFSTEKWGKYPEKRVDMVDDLLEKHELLGMTEQEVFLLLGQPTENAYFKTENNIVYYLGPERGLIRIDSEWLVLEIREQQVSKVDIFTD
ncbi:MAG: hypothetical protein PHU31_06925 [Anaerotignum sp.]|nr:hypothetical protein [Anaerotignum sp.]